MRKKLFLIQGIIFQKGTAFGFSGKPGVGLAVTIEKAMVYSNFSGIIAGKDNQLVDYIGKLKDYWGESTVTDFFFNNERITFTKHYPNRPGISYHYDKKIENVWYGTWSGADCGAGETKCVIIEADETFMYPQHETSYTEVR